MSYAIIEAKVYQWDDGKGNTLPDYLIMNLSDGKFLEWSEIEEVDEQCGCDGSVILHTYQLTEKVIKGIGGVVTAAR